jgi:hypothetical protein
LGIHSLVPEASGKAKCSKEKTHTPCGYWVDGMNNQAELNQAEMLGKLEEAVSDTSKSMLGLKNEYYRLKDIQADLKYELRKAKQTDMDLIK